MSDFVHLHTHSDYSFLDSCCKVDRLIDAAVENRMPALALTDYGNLCGAAEFYSKAKTAGLKPIIGMEAYLAPNRLEKSRLIYHLLLIVKDETGYRNLTKLSSLGYLEGFYYKPRIDKALLRQHAAGLIGTSACLKGEIPQSLMHGRYDQARAAALEYLDIFEGRFYLEVQRHGLEVEPRVIEGMQRLSADLNIPLVAANDIHYMRPEQAPAHEVLLCIQSGKTINDVTHPRYPGHSFYFRSSEEMKTLFEDIPSSIDNTLALAESVEFKMNFGQALLPKFTLPDGTTEDDYLRQLAFAGLREKVGDISESLRERLEYELDMIAKMGFPGYFLVVQDFINSAKKLGVSVGPGRGSAAGSLVSYAVGITNVDPIKYNLLFERFLNPERISMPDIDIDFDDRNRNRVIEYVIEKYGKDNVAQIITFGTMAARGVLRDVARALEVPLGEADRIAKMVPRKLGITLSEAIEQVPEMKALEQSPNPSLQKLLENARNLEGLVRQPGIHAAGVVITPRPLTELIPVYKSSRDEIATQFDKDWVEKIGLLKMDFLGLTTLTILDDACRLIEQHHGVTIDLDNIPLDDEATFQLFWRGETIGIFQFESQGMTEYMKQLKPTSIEDLIAMNALYRPGPMEFINTYIARKHGREPIDCYHETLEPILRPTYGVIVYQEQVMQVAQVLAGFSLGKADVVRRIMAKKKPDELEKIRPEWIEGAVARGYSKDLAEKIFSLLVPFSNYAFNKSHSAAYSILAYQTAYLKAHYPAEFMAAVLSSEMANTDRISVLISACREMGIEVLPPDVNASVAAFSVKDKTIRFGLGAVKNVGLGAIESIIQARQEHGPFQNLMDLAAHVDLRLVNKKVLESLVMSGACDSLAGHRAQQFAAVEMAVDHAAKFQERMNSDQVDIFGGALSTEENAHRTVFKLPDVPKWSHAESLAKEKELLGFYASGHPLDKYRLHLETFGTTTTLDELTDGADVRIGGMISEIRQIFDRKGNPMAFVKLEGLHGSIEVVVFASVMKDLGPALKKEAVVMVAGKVSYRNEVPSILCDRIFTMDEAFESLTGRIVLHVSYHQLHNGIVSALMELLQQSRPPADARSSCEVHLCVDLADRPALATYKINRFRIVPSMSLLNGLSKILGRGKVHIAAR